MVNFIISTINFWKYDTIQLIQILYIIQYGLYLFLFLFSKYNISNFLVDILSVEKKYHIEIFKTYNISLIIYVLFIISLNTINFYLYFFFIRPSLLDEFIKNFFTYFSILSIDMVPIIQIIIIYHIYMCVKKLRTITKNSNLTEIRQFYIDIVNCWDNIKPLYYKLTIPTIIEGKTEGDTINVLYLFRKERECTPTTSFPGNRDYSVTKKIVKVDIVTISLHSKITDIFISESYKEEIREVTQYMNTRRIADKAWDLMPIDVSLLTHIFSITITYLIVIIQFSHLYD
ncbi:uncharacterized protein LOC123721946 [Papilio machaon]|uniref:uncharacterized protein LOC123721946 n=1 Tax=Papilio machaon TaxID=76193 RepID=UPI001E663456|nr:uncharacterized protein LOC123721946 [Papilio machaon]